MNFFKKLNSLMGEVILSVLGISFCVLVLLLPVIGMLIVVAWFCHISDEKQWEPQEIILPTILLVAFQVYLSLLVVGYLFHRS